VEAPIGVVNMRARQLLAIALLTLLLFIQSTVFAQDIISCTYQQANQIQPNAQNVVAFQIKVCRMPAAQYLSEQGYIFGALYTNSTTLRLLAYGNEPLTQNVTLYYVIIYYNWTASAWEYLGAYEVTTGPNNYITVPSNLTGYYVVFGNQSNADAFPPQSNATACIQPVVNQNPTAIQQNWVYCTFAIVEYQGAFIQNLNLPQPFNQYWGILLPLGAFGAFVIRRNTKDLGIALIASSVMSIVLLGALGITTPLVYLVDALALIFGVFFIYTTSEEQPT
jgi:hypothetical protein